MEEDYKPYTKLNLFSKAYYKDKACYIVYIKFLDWVHIFEYLAWREEDYDKVFFRDYIVFFPSTFSFKEVYPTDLQLSQSLSKITLK